MGQGGSGEELGGAVAWGHFPRPIGLDPAIPTSDEFPKFSEPKSLSAKSREGLEEGGRGLGVTGDPWSWGSASAHILHAASYSQLFSPLDREPLSRTGSALLTTMSSVPGALCDTEGLNE